MTLRAKCISTSRAGLDGCHVLLNLSGHHLLLQARRQRFSFCYSQSHGGRGDFLRPLAAPELAFDGAAWDRLKCQLDCPIHPQRAIQPTTLHTLLARHCVQLSTGRAQWKRENLMSASVCRLRSALNLGLSVPVFGPPLPPLPQYWASTAVRSFVSCIES